MESLEFILVIGVFATILFWYLQNEEKNADGQFGLLAIAADPELVKPGKRAYRMKKRLARRAHEMRDTDATKTVSDAAPTYRVLSDNERMRRKFRRQDEARYRVKDKAATYAKRPHPRDNPSAA